MTILRPRTTRPPSPLAPFETSSSSEEVLERARSFAVNVAGEEGEEVEDEDGIPF